MDESHIYFKNEIDINKRDIFNEKSSYSSWIYLFWRKAKEVIIFFFQCSNSVNSIWTFLLLMYEKRKKWWKMTHKCKRSFASRSTSLDLTYVVVFSLWWSMLLFLGYWTKSNKSIDIFWTLLLNNQYCIKNILSVMIQATFVCSR